MPGILNRALGLAGVAGDDGIIIFSAHSSTRGREHTHKFSDHFPFHPGVVCVCVLLTTVSFCFVLDDL